MIRFFVSLLLLAVLTPQEVVDKAGAQFDGQHWKETIDIINESLPSLRQSGDIDNLAGICLAMENYDEGERLIHVHKRDKKLLQEASDIKGKLLVLTSREREIALLCGSGMVNKEIAEHLALSPRTVETHKGNIFRKLGINSTAELSEIIKKIEA